jgi:hypothetical protein
MDVTGVAWRKSSYSGDNGGTCVEVGTFGPSVAVRDSNHPDGPQLAFPASTWQALTRPPQGMTIRSAQKADWSRYSSRH